MTSRTLIPCTGFNAPSRTFVDINGLQFLNIKIAIDQAQWSLLRGPSSYCTSNVIRIPEECVLLSNQSSVRPLPPRHHQSVRERQRGKEDMASLHFTTNGRFCFSSPLRPPRALRRFISLRSPLLSNLSISLIGVLISFSGELWISFEVCFIVSFGLLEVYALSSNDIKVGVNIEVDGAPWKVLGLVSTLHIPFLS